MKNYPNQQGSQQDRKTSQGQQGRDTSTEPQGGRTQDDDTDVSADMNK